jgi:hypothetical protein
MQRHDTLQLTMRDVQLMHLTHRRMKELVARTRTHAGQGRDLARQSPKLCESYTGQTIYRITAPLLPGRYHGDRPALLATAAIWRIKPKELIMSFIHKYNNDQNTRTYNTIKYKLR